MKRRMFEVKARAWVITFAILITYHLSLITSTAQTFTQQVQQHRAGEGTVTIHQDADIDRLVNGSASPTRTAETKAAATTAAKTSSPSKPVSASKSSATSSEASRASTAKTPKDEPKAEKPKAKPQTDTTKSQPQSETAKSHTQTDATHGGTHDVPVGTYTEDRDTTIVTSAPRHGYKTTGYRVQAFAGGNTRNDRQKAERTGNALRQLFPGEDVYVRFYSPRWVCRMGNYRTYEEAHEKMNAVRKLGYETATIVKGKIIVYSNQ